MELQELVANRHSTRSFSDQEVSQDVIETIIREAQTTASWVNSQPWKVYVALGHSLEKIKKKHLDRIAQGEKSQPIFPVLSRNQWQPDQQENMAVWSRQKEAFQAVSDEEFWQLNRQLFKSPALIYFALPKSSPAWSIVDMGAFVQTATLSANNLGLGTMVAYELVKFPRDLAEILAVDEHYEIVIGMAIGYEDNHPVNHFRADRRRLEDILRIVD